MGCLLVNSGEGGDSLRCGGGGEMWMRREIDGGEGVVYREGDERGFEWCVKEREKERYCRRAGVMSTNEEEEEEGLPV